MNQQLKTGAKLGQLISKFRGSREDITEKAKIVSVIAIAIYKLWEKEKCQVMNERNLNALFMNLNYWYLT